MRNRVRVSVRIRYSVRVRDRVMVRVRLFSPVRATNGSRPTRRMQQGVVRYVKMPPGFYAVGNN